MNVSVFGLGYVGCVTAACLARSGHRVFGVDVSSDKVAMINDGRSPIVEPGLGELLADVVRQGRLSATTFATQALRESDAAIICVGTPSLPHGRPDVDAIDRVGQDIGRAIADRRRPLTVILRSTVLPGTTERVLATAIRAASGRDAAPVRLAMNPEFMREGTAIADFDRPPLIVVGVDDPQTAAVVRELYAEVDAPFVATAIRTAELVKYAANAYHALKVAFANEMAAIADALGSDAKGVMEIFRMDHKLNISEAYLRPGFAFGGSCLPKDVRALVWAGRANDVDTPILSSILPSNTGLIHDAVERILATHARRIGVVGLAFKPDTDDLRESPVVRVVEALIGKGCDVRILDPRVSLARLVGANRRYIETEIPHIASLLCDDVETLSAHAEVLVIGSPTAEAAAALSTAGGRTVIDLTRGAVRAPAPLEPEAQPSWVAR